MTFKQLQRIIKQNNIPEDVLLRSNSGWECCATDMNGIYYNSNNNQLHFTEYARVEGEKYDEGSVGYRDEYCDGWIRIKTVYQIKCKNIQGFFDGNVMDDSDAELVSSCNEYDIWNLSKELYDRLVSYTEDECEEVCGNDKWWVNVDD